MYVTNLKISDVLGFHGARNVDLDFARPDGTYAGLTVLAGRNGSGKTSLLRCLALLLLDSRAGWALAPGYADWRARSEKDGHLAAGFLLDAKEAEEFDAEGPKTFTADITLPAPSREERDGPRWPVVTRRSASFPVGAHDRQRTGTGEAARMAPGPIRDSFAAGYGPFRRLSTAHPEARTNRFDGNEAAARFATLFSEDAALGESVSWLIGLHLRKLEQREGAGALLDAVLALLADGLLPDGHRVQRVDSDGLWVSGDGGEFPLRHMSDGYRTVTALVLDLVRALHDFHGAIPLDRSTGVPAVRLPGVVLIDEIDAHLHVSWQQRIGDWLKAHFPLVQFIVTTHSPYICQSADPGGLIRLAGPDEDEPPRVVDESLYRRVVYGSGDDAALSELFGLDSPYSRRAEDVRRELVRLEERVFSGAATEDEVHRYQELSERLTSSSSARVDEVAARLGGATE
ncbi:AAA family ATPase [Streptomyces sp. NPDC003077]|uniref:AAA family ATPase n=1 Tax=Streptomyces sp. NPDC003077 TaxID=3154443 RepID=UPI0033B82056